MTAPSPWVVGLTGACPRCGARTLFERGVRFAPTCTACRLDFTAFNVGDGPAAFLILVVGAVLTIAAIWVELAFSPPFWVHLIWLPIGLLLTVGGLRFGKGLLLALEYRHRAGEGKIVE